jgi:thymidylate kinase
LNKPAFIKTLISVLNNSNYNWCIPSNYDKLPAHVTSHIDVVVSEKPLKVVRHLAQYFSTFNCSWKLVQCYEGKNCFCVFAAVINGKLDTVYVDLFQHYYYEGKKIIDGNVFLKNIRQYDSILIPSTKVEFIYMFIKKVLRQTLLSNEFHELEKLYNQDRSGCLLLLFSYFNWESVEKTQRCLKEHDYNGMLSLFKDLKKALLFKGTKKFFTLYNRQKFFLVKAWKRIIRPPGIEVICLGPDGSGKSTAIKEFEKEIKPIFYVQKYHLRSFPPKLYRDTLTKQPSTYRKPAYSFLFSFIKLLSYVIFYWFDRLFITNPKKLREAVILLDRSYHDVQIDPHRFRMKIPLFIIKLIVSLFPKPDLFFIFDAPTELIQKRKQEVSLQETARQRKAYKQFKAEYKHAFMINTDLPVFTVSSQMNRIVIAFMEERLKRRLKIRK